MNISLINMDFGQPLLLDTSYRWTPAISRHSVMVIGVRAGGGEGGCSPPKFWATQIFWATRENLGKASF